MYRSLSTPLDLAKFRKQGAHIGVRKMLTILDSGNQTLNASTTVEVSFDSGVNSSSHFGNKGADINLGADDALVIEHVGVLIAANDNSAKLKLHSMALTIGNPVNGAVILPLNTIMQLPYTFAAVALDSWSASMCLDRFAFYHNENIAFPLTVLAQGALENTDAGGAHVYLRGLTMCYRIVSGLDASTPLVLPMDS